MPTIDWSGEIPGAVEMIDQTLLPGQCTAIRLDTPEEVHEAIRSLRVRGAPAIGIAAAMGLVLGIQDHEGPSPGLLVEVERVAAYLATARPTAVNLFWALERMKRRARAGAALAPPALKAALLAEAREILAEDRRMGEAIGRHGAELVADGSRMMTHCNAGGLATGGSGTALSVFFSAHAQGKRISVFAGETRPLLQGARLTSWELMRAGIDVTLICDSMAAQVMKEGIDGVVVGADRIAANGDTANKIGTYGLSVLARAHGVPFYVAAPTSTFDLSLCSGDLIPIEERAGEEITGGFGRRTAPEGVKTYSPAFDVTPAANITAIVTEKGVLRPPFVESIRAAVGVDLS